MFSIYILKSEKNGRHYIGSCEDLHKRLNNHNDGLVHSTKAYRPWKIVHHEQYQTRGEARKREIQIKTYKGGEGLHRLLANGGSNGVPPTAG